MRATYRPGNDVVDLRSAENVRSAINPDYARRILSKTEWEHYLASGKSAQLLWLFWSAKEAAYKSMRDDDELIFSHARFDVRPHCIATLKATTGRATGAVRSGDHEVPVRWDWTPDFVHCVSGSDLAITRASVRAIRDLDDPQYRSRYADLPEPSRAVRHLAHQLLGGMLEVPGSLRISRHARRAPELVLGDAVWEKARVTLSHDDRFVAAAAICYPA